MKMWNGGERHEEKESGDIKKNKRRWERMQGGERKRKENNALETEKGQDGVKKRGTGLERRRKGRERKEKNGRARKRGEES